MSLDRARISAHNLDARRRRRGQTLVEFALVFPLFITLLMGVTEFAFVFNAVLSVNYASRDAALAGAEAGDGLGSDCVILKAVDDAIGPPTNDERIVSVSIFRADAGGRQLGAATIYNRSGSHSCTFIDGTTSTQSYTLVSDGYPVSSRCNILAGCGTGRDSVDISGVRISYTHRWVTPLRNFVGGGSGGITFDRSSIMRMEPVL